MSGYRGCLADLAEVPSPAALYLSARAIDCATEVGCRVSQVKQRKQVFREARYRPDAGTGGRPVWSESVDDLALKPAEQRCADRSTTVSLQKHPRTPCLGRHNVSWFVKRSAVRRPSRANLHPRQFRRQFGKSTVGFTSITLSYARTWGVMAAVLPTRLASKVLLK